MGTADPAGALQVMRSSGVAANRVVYVGDTRVDYDTARNAGIDCVLMTWGQGDASLFGEPGITASCDNAEELLDVLMGGD